MTDSFPRQYARTRRFSLGVPRSFKFIDQGRTLLFLRSKGGADPVTCLWSLDCATGSTTIVADPADLAVDDANLPAAERQRRERAREQADGIVAFAVGGPDEQLVSFTLGGVPHIVDLATSAVRPLDIVGSAFDARVSPAGDVVAYVDGDALHLVGSATSDRLLVGEDTEHVSWGSAEFVAGEEMNRTRGYWWAPDATAIAVARVDVSEVAEWQLADPTHPQRPVVSMRYPAAGETNASVSLWIVPLAGNRVEAQIDWSHWEYLGDVAWDADGLRVVVLTRDQRHLGILDIDPNTGETSVIREIVDDLWVELVPGVPALHEGQLVTVEERDGTRQMCLGGEPVSGPKLWVRAVAGSYMGGVVFTASVEPTEVHVYRWTPAGVEQLTSEPGVHAAVVGDPAMLISTSNAASTRRHFRVRSGAFTFELDDLSEVSLVEPQIQFLKAGETEIATAVLFPTEDPGGELPVLLDPYGGPHVQRVTRSSQGFATSQWFADQGFIVIVADNRGTPGRPGDWERSVYGDLAGPVLEDQITALNAVAAAYEGRLDLSRVGVRGWSFGGFLAALAVLRHPDVFHAAVAGAPVTDWRLYDTFYTERYLGNPKTEPENYERSSPIGDARLLSRPLMIIHGLADDNVVSAHTLRLSQALLEAGKPHAVLPLSGVSHMTSQEVVAENLLLLQVEFLKTSLGV